MTSLPHIAAKLFNRPLLCEANYAATIATTLADRLAVEPLVSADVAQSYVRPALDPELTPEGIVVFPVTGSMVHRGGGLDVLSGIQSYTALQSDLAALVASPKVSGILLDLDTPGGEAAGIVELSDFVRAAGRQKPIWALANSCACSAGYWLAASTSRIVAAPMSYVGSVGVVTMHQDVSKALEKRGVVTTLIHAGKNKVDGSPFAPLPDAVRASIQADIDDLYRQFVAAIASMRGLSESAVRATEAQTYGPDEAVLLGLADATGTLGATLQSFANFLRGGRP